MGPIHRDDALVRTKRTWLLVAGVVFAVAAFEPLMFAALHAIAGHALFWLFVPAYYGGIFGLFHAWNRSWLEERGRMRADERGLWLGERCVIARTSIRHGYVLEREGRWYVRLGRMVRLVDVEVDDEASGAALLAAMRLDGARSVAQYPMTHGTFRGSVVRAALCTVPLIIAPIAAHLLGGNLTGFIGALLVATILTLLFTLNLFVRVSIGADGMRVRRLLQRSRFIPFSSIDDAETDGRDITVRLQDGETIAMHHPAGRGFKPLAFADRALEGRKLVERIKEQVAQHRAKRKPEAPVLARAGRETSAWLRDVASAADVHASYRSPAVPADELWRIVEDAAAPTTARAGAAVALRQALDAAGRDRLEVVADACAAPRLRVALETVASTDDDDLLCAALAPLEDDEPKLARALPRGE